MPTYTIPAQPHPISLDLARTALLVIDMQKDFLSAHGFGAFLGNDTSLLLRTVEPTQRVLAMARKLGMLVVHTREGHPPDLSDCPPSKLERWSPGTRIGDRGPMGRILVQGEAGHAIIDELAPLAGEVVLDKPGKNSFYATDLDSILKGHNIRTLIITGVTTDVCVFTTTTAANDHGYDAIVLADCVASYSPERHRFALETIQAQGGIFGWVSDSVRVLTALAPTSDPAKVQIVAERPDTADALRLIEDLEAHLATHYAVESRHGFSVEKLIAQNVAFFVVRYEGIPAGCGGVKLFDSEYGEIKRMFVRPQFRGLGLAKMILTHLEEYAQSQGVNLMRLETGIYQTEAIRLYERFGYYRIPPFGNYWDDPVSLCYEKKLTPQ